MCESVYNYYTSTMCMGIKLHDYHNRPEHCEVNTVICGV